ncbi:hypothetical protein Pcinc_014283 [Petrolisthes cinctipes]|uniref:methylcrotonoyl-CoA carboxylase n=1 Tax=Petrolisthes cinctipes TaxID=88211 RepID=A0AAE1FWR2_PETCI|nr:hypothetical protein Pcinc_014283 [Petrolisthes cinctipes]
MLVRQALGRGAASVATAGTSRCMSTKARPFPLLQDTLNPDCPQFVVGRNKAEEEISKIHKLNKLCLAGGGEKGVALHVKRNRKLLVRDKLKLLLDDDKDFLELSLLAGLGMEYGDVPAAGAINGIGKIHDRYCLVSSSDGTVKSGTFFPISVVKNLRIQEICAANRLPAVVIVDSAGGFLPLQSELFADKKHGGRGFYNTTVMSSDGIPQLAIVCGSCTAGGAYQPAMCEDAVMVTGIGTLFLGGPPLVKAATGENITAEDLGGATVHTSVSGVMDYYAENEAEGFEMIRDLVATLNLEPPSPPPLGAEEPVWDQSLLDGLIGLERIDREKLYGVIGRLVDGGRFREFKQRYGRNLTVGYALIEGRCVGVVGNCGPLTKEDGLKGAHFIQICQQRGLPLIFLQNSGGVEEHQAANQDLDVDSQWSAMKGRATMVRAVSCVTVPKVTINIGSCHGDDNYTMCGPSFSPNFLFAWPGVEVTHTHNPPPAPLTAPPHPPPTEKASKPPRKPLSAFTFPPSSCLYHASRCLIDGIILPSQTRKVVAQCLRICRQQESLTRNIKQFPVFSP